MTPVLLAILFAKLIKLYCTTELYYLLPVDTGTPDVLSHMPLRDFEKPVLNICEFFSVKIFQFYR